MWSKIFKIHTGGNLGNTCDTEKLRISFVSLGETEITRAAHQAEITLTSQHASGLTPKYVRRNLSDACSA